MSFLRKVWWRRVPIFPWEDGRKKPGNGKSLYYFKETRAIFLTTPQAGPEEFPICIHRFLKGNKIRGGREEKNSKTRERNVNFYKHPFHWLALPSFLPSLPRFLSFVPFIPSLSRYIFSLRKRVQTTPFTPPPPPPSPSIRSNRKGMRYPRCPYFIL